MESGQHSDIEREFRIASVRSSTSANANSKYTNEKETHDKRGWHRPILNEEKKCKEHDNIIKGLYYMIRTSLYLSLSQCINTRIWVFNVYALYTCVFIYTTHRRAHTYTYKSVCYDGCICI